MPKHTATADDFCDDVVQGRRMVAFHYVTTGQTHQGQVGTVMGVVEMPRSTATRAAGFVYAMGLLSDHLGTRIAGILHFSFERDAL